MLAGRMKLKTFAGIAGALGLAGVGGAIVATNGGPDETQDKPAYVADVPQPKVPERPAPRRPVPPRPAPPPISNPAGDANPSPQPAVDGPSARPADQAMMKWVGRNLGSKKRKDVTRGQAFKINVYQDAGMSTANRAKLDLDRDGKWDEKWTFKPGEISRKVSTADNDSYDKKQVWKDGGWSDR